MGQTPRREKLFLLLAGASVLVGTTVAYLMRNR